MKIYGRCFCTFFFDKATIKHLNGRARQAEQSVGVDDWENEWKTAFLLSNV